MNNFTNEFAATFTASAASFEKSKGNEELNSLFRSQMDPALVQEGGAIFLGVARSMLEEKGALVVMAGVPARTGEDFGKHIVKMWESLSPATQEVAMVHLLKAFGEVPNFTKSLRQLADVIDELS